MGLNCDLRIQLEREPLPKVGQNCDQLVGPQGSGSASSEVDRLEVAPIDVFFSGLQPAFCFQGMKKYFRRRFPIEFQIEGAKITTLPAEWYMKVQSDRNRHDVNENGMGFEKSLATTISISSVEEIPRLRTCEVQAGCWRSDSKICFSMCGFM